MAAPEMPTQQAAATSHAAPCSPRTPTCLSSKPSRCSGSTSSSCLAGAPLVVVGTTAIARAAAAAAAASACSAALAAAAAAASSSCCRRASSSLHCRDTSRLLRRCRQAIGWEGRKGHSGETGGGFGRVKGASAQHGRSCHALHPCTHSNNTASSPHTKPWPPCPACLGIQAVGVHIRRRLGVCRACVPLAAQPRGCRLGRRRLRCRLGGRRLASCRITVDPLARGRHLRRTVRMAGSTSEEQQRTAMRARRATGLACMQVLKQHITRWDHKVQQHKE